LRIPGERRLLGRREADLDWFSGTVDADMEYVMHHSESPGLHVTSPWKSKTTRPYSYTCLAQSGNR
jgi:hypothetical protein